uniref:Uncharacterized protein n=1 Tax=Arundo donax TaxID=35708 RepID=A0A0A9B2Q8_ARUDO
MPHLTLPLFFAGNGVKRQLKRLFCPSCLFAPTFESNAPGTFRLVHNFLCRF